MRVVVLDFETMGFVDLKKSGAWRYAEDPLTDIICACYEVLGEYADVWTPASSRDQFERLNSLAADPEVIFVAHAAGFEKSVWRHQMVALYGFAPIPNSRWHDTQAVCAMRNIPLDLDTGARVLGLPVQKDMEGRAVTLGMSRMNKKGYYDRSQDKLDRAVDYCKVDILTQSAMLDEIGYLPVGERNVWLLDQRINERGVRIDMGYVHAAQRVVADASLPLMAEFNKLTNGINATQREKVLSWLTLVQGVDIPNLKKETVERLLKEDEPDETSNAAEDDAGFDADPTPDLPPDARRALAIRSLIGSASIKKLDSMANCVGLDGRAHGLLQYHAAGTGRWGGRLLQPQNFPRGSILVDKKPPPPQVVVDAIMSKDWEFVEATLGPAIEVVIGGLRHALVAAPGRKYVVGDFAGIEARIVLALAGQHDKTALMASGADVYIDMALDIYKMPKFDVSDKKLIDAFKAQYTPRRTIGKNTILGCGFQMGAKTFRSRYCPDQTVEFSEGVISSYRREWAPLVPALWRGLEDAALETVQTGQPHEYAGVLYEINGRWLTARLPSGRRLWYFNPTRCRKTMPWSTPDKPDVREAWRFQAKKAGKWVWVDAYGGILTENVVQALARDLLVAAMFKCENNGIPVVLTVHDEIVSEPTMNGPGEVDLEQIMCDIPDWARAIQVPVQTETWTGERYKK